MLADIGCTGGMAPNHGRRGVLGRGVYALLACAVVAMTGSATGAAAGRTVGGPSAPVLTKTFLTSVGTGGAAATAPSARPAISANGRYVAFQSQATLNVSASVVPPPPPGSPPVSNSRVYVRDQTGTVTSQLSDPITGNATAPAISGTGKLVSYLFDGGIENSVVVVNRQATGKGAFDTKKNLVVRTVTGNSRDVMFERIPGCATGIGDTGAIRTTPCGPRLSADGTTLVYPAQLSPVTPALAVTDSGDPAPGNVIDFGGAAPGQFDPQSVNYTVTVSHPVTLTGFTTTGPFTVTTDNPELNDCVGTIQPGATCFVQVVFNTGVCPENGTGEFTGTLRTDAAVPDGQTSVALVAFCNSAFGEDATRPGGPLTTLTAAAGCAAPPAGLPVVQAPATEQDNSDSDLVDFGPAVIGQPFAAIVKFTAPADATIQFSSAGCGLQLISPAAIGLPAGQPITCTPSPESDADSCTADVLVTPGAVGTDAASLIAAQPDLSLFFTQVLTYLTVTGVSDVVIARHDKTGAGNFAASPSTVVSVDSTRKVIPGASEPSVSANGRYVAFTASAPTAHDADSTSVWRHDTDAAGNGTNHAGATIKVSCLPGAGRGTCDADAGSPSISGDGSRVAFATIAVHGQVYVRDVTAATTALVSAPATGKAGGTANGDSYAPAMSQDGSTVAYISTATDLEAPATPANAANLYVRTLLPAAPAVSELASPAGASLPAGDDIALPSADARGGLVTFQTSQPLLPVAAPEVTSVYTFEREPALAFEPAPVTFAAMMAGSVTGTRTVTVTDAGPGPGEVTTAGTTAPFGTKIGACAGAVLHEGGTCTLTVSLTPRHPGTDHGSLTTTVTDDLGSPVVFTVPVTAIVAPEAARLSVDPAVAPPGQVTDVTGSGFIPGQDVTLSWVPGLGQASVVASGTGRLTAVMIIFTDDFTGPRVLEARDLSGQVLATVNFLAQQPAVEPPFGPASASR